MITIKFRAWDKERKHFNHFELDNDAGFYDIFYRAEKSKYCAKDSDWMQYTGLKDKNGKEIYEGDIVKVVTKDFDYPDVVNKGKVIFEKGHWLIMGNEEYYLYGQDEIEIIGNIYENPELLK